MLSIYIGLKDSYIRAIYKIEYDNSITLDTHTQNITSNCPRRKGCNAYWCDYIYVMHIYVHKTYCYGLMQNWGHTVVYIQDQVHLYLCSTNPWLYVYHQQYKQDCTILFSDGRLFIFQPEFNKTLLHLKYISTCCIICLCHSTCMNLSSTNLLRVILAWFFSVQKTYLRIYWALGSVLDGRAYANGNFF